MFTSIPNSLAASPDDGLLSMQGGRAIAGELIVKIEGYIKSGCNGDFDFTQGQHNKAYTLVAGSAPDSGQLFVWIYSSTYLEVI